MNPQLAELEVGHAVYLDEIHQCCSKVLINALIGQVEY